MPFDASANYTLPGPALVNGGTVSATEHNTQRGDVALALNSTIIKNQLHNEYLNRLTSVSGSNTITATAAVVPAAYAAGQRYTFVAAANNTGATTINISGRGAVAITKAGGTPLAPDDIIAGTIVEIVHDGTQFQLKSKNSVDTIPSIEALIGLDGTFDGQTLNALSYYTPVYPLAGTFDGGGGVIVWDDSQDKSNATGGNIIDPSVSLALQGTGVGVGCWVRIDQSPAKPEQYGGFNEAGVVAACRTGDYGDILNKLYGEMRGLEDFYTSSSKNIVCGIDSLTAGSGATSYYEPFKARLIEKYGYKGEYISFDIFNSTREGVSFGISGFQYIKSLDKTTAPAIYSFDFGGIHAAAFVSGNNMSWDVKRNWDTIDVYYLQQPGGAQFRIGQSTQPAGDKIVVDTNGVLSLQKVTITKAPSHASALVVTWVADGILTLFGAANKLNNDGVFITRGAYGGYKMQDYAGLDNTFQTAWFSSANLDTKLYILNGGMNDRGTRTPAEYDADVTTFVSNLPSACSKLLVAANSASDDATTNLDAYRYRLYQQAITNDYGFIDIKGVLGSYATANAAGFMAGDGVHPSSYGDIVIANIILDKTNMLDVSNDTAPAFDSGSVTSGYNYSGDLPEVHTGVITAGNSIDIYSLGLTNGSPVAAFELVVTANRDASGEMVRTRHFFRVTNGTTLNYATTVSTPTSREDMRVGASGMAHTVTAAIVSNRAVITLNCTVVDQIFQVEGRYSFGNLIVTGQSVYTSA